MDMSKMAVVVGNVTKSAPSGEGFIESTYVAPVYDSSARDFGSDFLLILILPLLVVFVISIILGIIFFCFREGRSVPWSYFARELCLYFLIKGLCTWREEDPGGRIIQAPYVFCIQFVCKGLSGLSESFEVDGLVVKVSGQFWRNWRAPKAQASRGFWGHTPPENFYI